LRSPDAAWIGGRLAPLLSKELREVLAGRALWTLLLVLCPLIGMSFVQAAALFGERPLAA
jgi:ABC-2 type transport system permease protein